MSRTCLSARYESLVILWPAFYRPWVTGAVTAPGGVTGALTSAYDADQPQDSCEPLDRINDWIPDGRLVDLTPPTFAAGAGNGLDAWLFGGGFKHFDIEDFIRVVEAQPWRDRRNLQLWVKGGEEGAGDESFTAVKLKAPTKSRGRR